jgi:hypothetical protein
MYPFVKAVAVFWEKYLKYEDGRYVIYNDAIHEGTVGNTNPILSLGFVKMVSQLAIDMSEYLGVDAERHEKWAELRDKISPYPTMERNGKTVYRLSEKGPAWYDGNSLATQHIYPGCQVGVFSDPKELEIARETLIQKNCWFDNNSSNTHFPAAVRVGLPADLIMEKLRQYVERQYPNGFQRNNPHGVENCSTVPNTINEMLCTGHQGVVRLFPVWQREQDASFYNLRVEGAFLVSAELKNGKIQNVIIKSEQGRDLILLNPYEGQKIKIQNGNEEKIYEGEQIKIPTKAGEIYRVLI